MITSNVIGIIADDLTGANDTALQFFSKGASTDIVLDYKNFPSRALSYSSEHIQHSILNG